MKYKLIALGIAFVFSLSFMLAHAGMVSAAVVDHRGHENYYYDKYGHFMSTSDITQGWAFRMGIEIRGINNSGTNTVQYIDGAVSVEIRDTTNILYVCMQDTALRRTDTNAVLSSNNGPETCAGASPTYNIRGTEPNVRVGSGSKCANVANWFEVKSQLVSTAALYRITSLNSCTFTFL